MIYWELIVSLCVKNLTYSWEECQQAADDLVSPRLWLERKFESFLPGLVKDSFSDLSSPWCAELNPTVLGAEKSSSVKRELPVPWRQDRTAWGIAGNWDFTEHFTVGPARGRCRLGWEMMKTVPFREYCSEPNCSAIVNDKTFSSVKGSRDGQGQCATEHSYLATTSQLTHCLKAIACGKGFQQKLKGENTN